MFQARDICIEGIKREGIKRHTRITLMERYKHVMHELKEEPVLLNDESIVLKCQASKQFIQVIERLKLEILRDLQVELDMSTVVSLETVKKYYLTLTNTDNTTMQFTSGDNQDQCLNYMLLLGAPVEQSVFVALFYIATWDCISEYDGNWFHHMQMVH